MRFLTVSFDHDSTYGRNNLDAALAARIPDLAKIVAFRNQLIHGYATVNVKTIWSVTLHALPPQAAIVEKLLDELGDD